jgi:hypothetical protein
MLDDKLIRELNFTLTAFAHAEFPKLRLDIDPP